MFSPECPFCDHANPAGAKFCNECGSPLHLKPCKQCEAINDRSAKNCYKCGTDDPALVIAPDGAPLSTAAESTVATAAPSGVGFERARLLLPETLALSHDVRSQRPDDATAIEPDVEVVAREPRSLGMDVRPMYSETPDTTQVVAPHNVAATAERRPAFRTAMAGLPPVVLLAVITVSAYYVYRNPLQLREWLSAVQTPVRESASGATMQSVPGSIDVQGPSAPSVSLGTGNVAAITSAAPEAPNEISTDVTMSSVRQGGTGASSSDGVDGQALTPNQFHATVVPQPPGLTSDQATTAQIATRKSSVAAPGAADARDNAMRAAGNQVAPSDAAAERSTATHATTTATAAAQSPPGKSRAKSPPPVTGPGGCTDAMAALGSCNPKKTSTSTKTTAKKSKKTSTKKPASTQATPGPKAPATMTKTSETAPGQ